MERYFTIAKVNLRYQLWPYVLVSILLCVISPLFIGVKNLETYQTARIIDVYLSLIGIILFVPIFLGDEDFNIRDLCASKKEPMFRVHLIRLLESLILMGILLTGYLICLKNGQCLFPFRQFLFGAVSNCLFLGGIGIVTYGITDLMPAAYMVPVMYYIMNFGSSGSKYLGKFYLFTLSRGQYIDKYYLLAAGILMIAAGIWFRSQRGTVFSLRRPRA